MCSNVTEWRRVFLPRQAGLPLPPYGTFVFRVILLRIYDDHSGKIPGREVPVNLLVENVRWFNDTLPKRISLRFRWNGFLPLPGFFDPQVNGFAGVDFNHPLLTPERLHQAARSLASTGVTCFLPTLITSSQEKMVRQLKIIAEALRNDSLLRKMCVGSTLKDLYFS